MKTVRYCVLIVSTLLVIACNSGVNEATELEQQEEAKASYAVTLRAFCLRHPGYVVCQP